jgi:hypothetical protein
MDFSYDISTQPNSGARRDAYIFADDFIISLTKSFEGKRVHFASTTFRGAIECFFDLAQFVAEYPDH